MPCKPLSQIYNNFEIQKLKDTFAAACRFFLMPSILQWLASPFQCPPPKTPKPRISSLSMILRVAVNRIIRRTSVATHSTGSRMSRIPSSAHDGSDALNAVLITSTGPLLMFLKYTAVGFDSTAFPQRLVLRSLMDFLIHQSSVGGKFRVGPVFRDTDFT